MAEVLLSSDDVILGDTVYLRPPKHDELQYIKWLWADPASMKEVKGPFHYSDEVMEKYYPKMASPSENYYYCLIFKADGQPIGEISFHNFNPQTKEAMFNIKVAADYRCQGYGKEAMQLFLRHYFLEFGGEIMLDDLYLDNYPGQQALLKFGFDHISEVKDAFFLKLTKEKFMQFYP